MATKEAKAVNIKHGGERTVTVEDLERIPTPEATKFWQPIAHAQVPQIIDTLVKDRDWRFIEPEHKRYDLVTTKEDQRLFGVTKVAIPGVDIDSDFEMAIGFRNSHDKTLALRVAVGTHVLVCANLVISGDIQVRRIHTRQINPMETISQAFDQIPGAAGRLSKWFGDLREMPITDGDGVALLASCVEGGALPIFSFMDARESFLEAYHAESEQILHGATAWAVYQAVTEQFKKYAVDRTQLYSTKLNAVFQDHMKQDIADIHVP